MKRRRGGVAAAALVGVVLTASLGLWQLDRAAQKRAWQAAVQARAALPALSAADLPPQLPADLLHRQVDLQGEWLNDRTVYLDNRPMSGQVGFFVVTPLRLAGRGDVVLVQRGWLPRSSAERNRLPQWQSPTGRVRVQGRLTAAPSRLFELGVGAPGPIRQNLDLAAYATEIGVPLLPLTVLQNSAEPADALRREWAAPDAGLQKHYGYAFQWFALSALILGLTLWFQILRPRRHA